VEDGGLPHNRIASTTPSRRSAAPWTKNPVEHDAADHAVAQKIGRSPIVSRAIGICSKLSLSMKVA
jgi:hypothetical protein